MKLNVLSSSVKLLRQVREDRLKLLALGPPFPTSIERKRQQNADDDY